MHAPPKAALASGVALVGVPLPAERFNVEACRAHKAAFLDDQGALSYGALDDRVRRLTAALYAASLLREERHRSGR